MPQRKQIVAYTVRAALIVALISLIPFLLGRISAPSGSTYLGVQYNTDDQMVYAAWMRQAIAGNFLFDNRFTTDSQPGLTINLYFFGLGQVARFLGIPWTAALARAAFSGLFVILLGKLLRKLTEDFYLIKIGLALTVFGAGLGFLFWHNFGVEIVKPSLASLAPLTQGKLPNDVWQPEAYVFPSMLTNGLFMVSLCLILGIFLAALNCKNSWKPVPGGAACFLILANIHSYDIVLVGLVLLGFLATVLKLKAFTWPWLMRILAMSAGSIPSAGWLAYVLQHDKVFQARAATETFSPNFKQLFFGCLLLLVPAFLYAGWRHRLGIKSSIVPFGIVATLYVLAGGHAGGYWFNTAAWCCLLLVVLAAIYFFAGENTAENLIFSWALVALVAPYLPVLFERKLAVGMSIPLAILAALGLGTTLQSKIKEGRILAAALVLLLCSATSIRWFFRERELAQLNVANTVVHPVYLSGDMRRIVGYLNDQTQKKIVLAMPGIPQPQVDFDQFATPYLADMNPILSGLTGAYTYAGHWSETPNYNMRRAEALMFFMSGTTEGVRRAFLKANRINFVVAPVPLAFPALLEGSKRLEDVSALGRVVVRGSQFQLVLVDQG